MTGNDGQDAAPWNSPCVQSHLDDYPDGLFRSGHLVDGVFLRSRKSHWYTYKGRFRFRNQDRVIVLEEADYDRLHNNSGPLQVFYQPAKDDFVPVAYSLGLSLLIGPQFFWFILGLVVKNTFSKPSKP